MYSHQFPQYYFINGPRELRSSTEQSLRVQLLSFERRTFPLQLPYVTARSATFGPPPSVCKYFL